MNSKKLAEALMDELYSFFDAYYIRDGGYSQMTDLIEKVIEENKKK